MNLLWLIKSTKNIRVNFETEKNYNVIKISPSEDEANFEITDFKFYPISSEDYYNYEISYIDEPDVIIDETGVHWTESHWNGKCTFDSILSIEECYFINKWGGASFGRNKNYNAGTLYINMKALYPDRVIQIQVYYPNQEYKVIASFYASDEFEDYYITIPDNKVNPIVRLAIQEGSQQENTYYIKKMVYYPSNIPVPTSSRTTKTKTTTTTTTTKRTTTSTTIYIFTTKKTTSKTYAPEPTISPKTEEEIYQDNGYEECSPDVKIAYAEKINGKTQIYGLENNQWCAIFNKNINTCWSNLYGVKCCSSSANVIGTWGTEPDGTKCGSNAKEDCWSKEMGYDCCTRNESDIIFVDEDGAWGSKNDNWCGII